MEIEYCEECGEPFTNDYGYVNVCRYCVGYIDRTIFGILIKPWIFETYFEEDGLPVQFWIDNYEVIA